MKNNSAELCAFKDADVSHIFSTKGPDIIYPMGIKVGDTLSELTDRWGQYTKDISSSYYDSNDLAYSFLEYPIDSGRVRNETSNSGSLVSATGCSYVVRIDRNTSQITNIKYEWVDKTQPEDKTVEDIRELRSWSNEVFELTYRIPYSIAQNISITRSSGMSVYTIDNTPYVVVLDFKISGLSIDLVHELKDFTKEELSKYMNPSYSHDKFEIETIEMNDSNKIALGYLYRNGSFICRTVNMAEHRVYNSHLSAIMPLNENDDISEAAIAKFKEIMIDYMRSFREIKK